MLPIASEIQLDYAMSSVMLRICQSTKKHLVITYTTLMPKNVGMLSKTNTM